MEYVIRSAIHPSFRIGGTECNVGRELCRGGADEHFVYGEVPVTNRENRCKLDAYDELNPVANKQTNPVTHFSTSLLTS